MDIDQLELSVRPRNCLVAAGIETVEQLIEMDWRELISLEHMGEKSLNEILLTLLSLYKGELLERRKEFAAWCDERYESKTPARKYAEIAKIVNGE